MDTIGLLTGIRCLTKAYEKTMKRICSEFELTLIQVKIIGFLHSNPYMNTAKDIVEFRMLTKSNVSAAVEDLIRRGYMERKPDTVDRRRVYLFLLEKARPVTDLIDASLGYFDRALLAGFTAEEIEVYQGFKDRITQNAKRLLDEM